MQDDTCLNLYASSVHSDRNQSTHALPLQDISKDREPHPKGQLSRARTAFRDEATNDMTLDRKGSCMGCVFMAMLVWGLEVLDFLIDS